MQLQAEYGKSKMHYFVLIDAASSSMICCLLYTSNILLATAVVRGMWQTARQADPVEIGTEQDTRH